MIVIDDKLKNFLTLISWSEGTCLNPLTKNKGYDVIVSGIHGPSVFTDYSNHPFAQGGHVIVHTNPLLVSTAAGRFQVLAHYFEAYKKQLQLPDFSPTSQDQVAIQQLRERHALPLIESGDIAKAITACCPIWASFPGNSYKQGGHTMEELLEKYKSLS